MRVEVNNMVFDSADPQCSLELCSAHGDRFAFITVLDGENKKQYWGRYQGDEAAAIREIMETGGKWPKLGRKA